MMLNEDDYFQRSENIRNGEADLSRSMLPIPPVICRDNWDTARNTRKKELCGVFEVETVRE